MNPQVSKLKLEEKQILVEAEKIEQAEKRIEKEEKELLRAESTILRKFGNKGLIRLFEGERSLRTLNYLRAVFVKRIERHKFLFAVIVTFSLVLIWRGTWETVDKLPIISDALISLIIGYFLIWLIEKYTELH